MYLIKTPWWLRALYPSVIWQVKAPEKTIYLTFDDGPHETATPFVLDQLQQYNAKATFFCIGKNVAAYPELYQRILNEGHATGNHTYSHVNGWKVTDDEYLKEVELASTLIKSNLFRPPYGRIKRSQLKKLQTSSRLLGTTPAFRTGRLQIIMWSVLSGDFDTSLSPEACLTNVLNNTKPGTIIVFHDSTKAWERLQYALPKVLEHFSKVGYTFSALEKNE